MPHAFWHQLFPTCSGIFIFVVTYLIDIGLLIDSIPYLNQQFPLFYSLLTCEIFILWAVSFLPHSDTFSFWLNLLYPVFFLIINFHNILNFKHLDIFYGKTFWNNGFLPLEIHLICITQNFFIALFAKTVNRLIYKLLPIKVKSSVNERMN